jgi:hypothetical protein
MTLQNSRQRERQIGVRKMGWQGVVLVEVVTGEATQSAQTRTGLTSPPFMLGGLPSNTYLKEKREKKDTGEIIVEVRNQGL